MNEEIPPWAAEIIAFQKQVLAILERIEQGMTAPTTQSPAPALITLPEFCARLNRCTKWGYQQISLRTIVPAKVGRPYQIPIEQIANFAPKTRRAGR